MSERRMRSDGEASRRRILDAAAEIAGERGYEGTTISLVSQRSGLPASSIYWYFKDKDGLIAAVIEDSHARWLASLPDPEQMESSGDRYEDLADAVRLGAASFVEFPDFMRLGLMLLLEHRPTEPSARRLFIDIRSTSRRGVGEGLREMFPDLEAEQIEDLAMLITALTEGCFLAAEAGDIELTDARNRIVATAIVGTARELARTSADRTRRDKRTSRTKPRP